MLLTSTRSPGAPLAQLARAWVPGGAQCRPPVSAPNSAGGTGLSTRGDLFSPTTLPRRWVGAWEGNNPALNPRPLGRTHHGANNSSRQEGQRRTGLPAALQAGEAEAVGVGSGMFGALARSDPRAGAGAALRRWHGGCGGGGPAVAAAPRHQRIPGSRRHGRRLRPFTLLPHQRGTRT